LIVLSIAEPRRGTPQDIDSAYAWYRLGVTVLLATIGGVGMWSVVVTLPAWQAEFDVTRAAVSLPYTLTMLGFGGGGILMGRLVDRFGVVRPTIGAVFALGLGYIAVASAPSLWLLALAQGLFIGIGSTATFGPFMADISYWFERRRGIAVTAAAAGNYLAGTFWPPVVQHFIASEGWRRTHIGIGLFCVATMLPLLLALRRRAPAHEAASGAMIAATPATFGLSARSLQLLLSIAGVGCCVAMSMPQVHIVAYCGDLGYGTARGAQMLSLMLGSAS